MTDEPMYLRDALTSQLSMPDQHIYHHNDAVGFSVNVKIEKNSKGYNWEVTVVGASSVAQALMVMNEAEKSLQAMYGTPQPTQMDVVK